MGGWGRAGEQIRQWERERVACNGWAQLGLTDTKVFHEIRVMGTEI